MSGSIITEEQVWQALRKASLPKEVDPAQLEMVTELSIHDGIIFLSIEIGSDEASAKESLRIACQKSLENLSGVKKVNVVLTSSVNDKREHTKRGRIPHSQAIPGVKTIIGVASGKGGVGKSTTAVNLALAFKAQGLSVGVLDADIYGPSLPRLLGVQVEKPRVRNGQMLPIEAHGLQTMSIGYVVPENTATIWRGPMATSAIQQFISKVTWENLDILVVDFPPGTGDIHLSLTQMLPMTGAIIVSTPQDIALIDARKGIAMFEKVNVPVIGILENMSHFICPKCGERTDIFSSGGAKAEADSSTISFLGEIPLEVQIREASDAGNPIVSQNPDSPIAKIYLEISNKVIGILSNINNLSAPPLVREE